MALNTGKYHKYLQSSHWHTVKKQYYKKRDYRCYVCGKRNNLELHHVTYKNIGNEQIEDLIYLCHKHHQWATFADDGSFQQWLETKRGKRMVQKRQSFENYKRAFRKNDKQLSNKIGHNHKRFSLHGRKQKKLKQPYGSFTWKAKEMGLV